MPKIIEHLPQRLADEARRQTEEGGFSALTIRSVASACGVGVGTVYNYYPSKEALVATYLLEDWQTAMADLKAEASAAQKAEQALLAICRMLRQYLDSHQSVFGDQGAAAGFTGAVGRYHSLLRSQLAEPIRPFCPDEFTALFIAESLLTWTVAGTEANQLLRVLSPMLRKEN
ncbi:MAG: TetR/AcrR family transcriptional regulator [Oscillospiraceae bacterium]|nr:TetR/AcrR family transcriptional regulator [Oscillospiraceae bacterium]